MTSRGPAPAGVPLGFEIGTGEPVSVPLGHMVITGQTQLSGKTTTLEALVTRSGRAAIAFVTKRGEGSFGGGRQIPPFFRERADWQFVSSILESLRSERMKMERAWIVRACKGARSLRDVRDNVRKLMGKTRPGFVQDMYMLLGEYLDEIVPMVARLPKSDELETKGLAPGLNVMDLREYPEQLQTLVIASTLAWVHQRAEDVLSLVPEAWKFMPRGRNTPVKIAATAIAREGAVLHNLLWIDLQDLAGADYEVMRGASVWVLGVQRERNEVKRAIEQIPAGFKKPRPDDVTSLLKGHFIVCTPTFVKRVYVQPAWLDAETARRVATGDEAEIPAPPAAGYDYSKWRHGPTHLPPGFFKEPAVAPATRAQRQEQVQRHFEAPPHREVVLASTAGLERRGALANVLDEETEMSQEDMKQIGKMMDDLGQTITAAFEKTVRELTGPVRIEGKPVDEAAVAESLRKPSPIVRDDDPLGHLDIGVLADFVIDRLRKTDPKTIRLLLQEARLDVEVETTVVKVDGTTLRGRIARLIADSFFDETRDGPAILAELRRRGGPVNDSSNYQRELGWLAHSGFLTREGDAFRAVSKMKVNLIEK